MKVLSAPRDGYILDARQTMYPSSMEVLRGATRSLTCETSTVFGYVISGNAVVTLGDFRADLPAGGYFSIPGTASLEVPGVAVAIERFGFRGTLQIGVIEDTGRLSYIDGCSDSVLCMPPRAGDPVLNHLHFPLGVKQSLHSHPSVRLGVVARGGGVAHGPAGEGWQHALTTGAVFLVDAHEIHAFRTTETAMDVIAFHPDSDWGPTDRAHPMVNRTLQS
jgi:hypothetical protein